jgi:MFS transporter, DHA3 family, macrolide efflux protein
MSDQTTTTDVPDAAASRQRRWAASFFTIWTGQALSLVGSQVGGFALVWWLTQASGGSATVLATASLFAMLPSVVLGPVAGALVDRWSRRRVMIVGDSLVAAFSAWLGIMAWTGSLQIWHIYVIVFVRALGGTFHFTAMQAATSLMVPETQLARISGMNQTLRGVLDIVSPPLGALAMSLLPLHTIMGIDVATAAFAVAPLFFIHIPEPVRQPKARDARIVPDIAHDIRDGFLYIWHWQGLFIVLIVASLLNAMINPAFSLMPILVQEHFGGGPVELGWTQSAWGIGMIAGGLLLSVWGGFKRRILTSLLGLVLAGFSFGAVGITPPHAFNAALVGLFVSGLSNPLINGPFLAILQAAVAPEIQGRVFTAVQSLAGLAAPLGMVIAGPLADRFGVQVWFLIGGVISLMMGVGLRFVPSVMHLEDRAAEPTTNGSPTGADGALPTEEKGVSTPDITRSTKQGEVTS